MVHGPENWQSAQQQLTHVEALTQSQIAAVKGQGRRRGREWAHTPSGTFADSAACRRCKGAVHLVDQALVVEQQQASLHTVTVHHTPELRPQPAHRGEGGEQRLSQVFCSQLLCVWLCQGCVASLLPCSCVMLPEAQQQLQIILEAGLVRHENISNQQLVDDASEPPAETEVRGQLIGMLV